MILFPNAKINLGLFVTEKRADGYHNLESIFVPVPLSDVLEIIPSDKPTHLQIKGIALDSDMKSNLVYKAWDLLKQHYDIPFVDMILLKNIPFGAGLGGGSADASFCLKGISDLFNLNISTNTLKELASTIGADCPFFIENKPALVSGIGNIMEAIQLDLSTYHIVLTKPNFSIPTPLAYKNIAPQTSKFNLATLHEYPIEEWKNVLYNDFELALGPQFPELDVLKLQHYQNGAAYAQMTGSGSAVFGIYKSEPETQVFDAQNIFVHKGKF